MTVAHTVVGEGGGGGDVQVGRRHWRPRRLASVGKAIATSTATWCFCWRLRVLPPAAAAAAAACLGRHRSVRSRLVLRTPAIKVASGVRGCGLSRPGCAHRRQARRAWGSAPTRAGPPPAPAPQCLPPLVPLSAKLGGRLKWLRWLAGPSQCHGALTECEVTDSSQFSMKRLHPQETMASSLAHQTSQQELPWSGCPMGRRFWAYDAKAWRTASPQECPKREYCRTSFADARRA
jgi:hypothetical protein